MTPPPSPSRHTKRSQHSRSAGFTLVELLVTLAIISVLLAISLPALRMAKTAAQQGMSLHNLKQNADRFYVHAAERHTFPVAPPGTYPDKRALIGGNTLEQYSYVVFPQGGGIIYYYLSNETDWNLYLVSLGDEPATETWYSPSLGQPDPRNPGNGDPFYWWAIPSHYHYSLAFMASPEYFRDPTAQSPAMWRAVRPEEVAYPAIKALLVETSSGVKVRYPNAPVVEAPTPIAFADGHVAARRLANATEPAANRPNAIVAQPLMQTYNGFLGRDF